MREPLLKQRANQQMARWQPLTLISQYGTVLLTVLPSSFWENP
ncbi:MAG: hypothetical protein RMJ19_07245 [Gemmatales bacterium]|nr:hypothetical protein [Gemmatales bacterium]MDW8175450.1 hypothetical protein [Gemmatales bacterium]